jgi:diketogulonate reductase-like aldo/keto reductase
LCTRAKVRPAFVQNRCFARLGWDRDVRNFCRDHGIVYQGFSLLTANVNELRTPRFWSIVDRTERTPAQVVFRFAVQSGMLPLTGTTNPDHMREDLEVFNFELTADEVRDIENIAAGLGVS